MSATRGRKPAGLPAGPYGELFRRLPKVDVVAADPLLAAFSHAVRVGAAQQVLDELRSAIKAGDLLDLPSIAPLVAERARWLSSGRLRPVINATGIVVHTNLGRAPWSASAQQAALRAAGPVDLEIDLDEGKRGGRLRGVSAQVKHLTGAEATLVVNNCAAAVLLALTTFAKDREVIVSRGELVEIGGAFRVPDVIASGGARLVEVGTTNRTRLSDYERAIRPETAVLLRVHPSNFRIVGFVEEVPREELVALGRARNILVFEDVGAGSLTGKFGEPAVRSILASGVDLVTFSGDKLLGGPQAGILAGRADVVAKVRKHPLYRALRVDKVTLAALEATLGDHASGRPTPVDAMMEMPPEVLEQRAQRLAGALRTRGVAPEVVAGESFVGGGALPGQALPTRIVRVAVEGDEDAAHRLRTGDPPVLARVHQGALHLDVRTVEPDLIDALAARVAEVVGS